MNPPYVSRRALLVSALAAAGCAPKKGTPYAGYCFVANQEARSVAIVDLIGFRSLRTVPLGDSPSAVLAHPKQTGALVLAPGGGTVYEIDAASLAISRRARAGNQAVGMRLAPAGDALWVLFRDPAALVELPLDSLQPRRRVRLPAPPDDFDLSSDRRAAVVSRQGSAVTLVSLDHAVIERTMALPVEPTSVRFRPDGRQVLAASRPDRSVTILDTPTGKTIVRLPLPMEPRHFCYNSDNGQLFVTGDGMDAVAIIYPYQTDVAETVLAGHAPSGMAVTDSYLLVANPQTNSVTVLDIDTDFKLVAVVRVGNAPQEIVVTPDQQYALVLNQGSGDLAVIRIAALAARRYKSGPLFTMIPVGAGPVSAAVVKLS